MNLQKCLYNYKAHRLLYECYIYATASVSAKLVQRVNKCYMYIMNLIKRKRLIKIVHCNNWQYSLLYQLLPSTIGLVSIEQSCDSIVICEYY